MVVAIAGSWIPTGKSTMSSQFTTFVERHPGFYQKRISLPLNEMMAREIDRATGRPTVIRELFDYWQEQRDDTLPTMASFDPEGVFTPDRFRWVAWIDVANSDPLNAILFKHPANIFGDWSGKALCEYHSLNHAQSCALEYLTCKIVRRPFYHEIRQTIGNVSRTYSRLLLPVIDRKGQVRRLYYAARHIASEIDCGSDNSFRKFAI